MNSSGVDGTVRVWDVATSGALRPSSTTQTPGGATSYVDVSADGAIVTSAGAVRPAPAVVRRVRWRRRTSSVSPESRAFRRSPRTRRNVSHVRIELKDYPPTLDQGRISAMALEQDYVNPVCGGRGGHRRCRRRCRKRGSASQGAHVRRLPRCQAKNAGDAMKCGSSTSIMRWRDGVQLRVADIQYNARARK